MTRANGITAAMAMPGGGMISGQASLMHLDGWTWEEMAVKPSAAMHLRFPVLSMAGARGGARTTFTEAKRNHDEEIQKLHLFFEDARRYQRAKPSEVDRKFEAMLPVLEGKQQVMVTAAQKRAISEALDFAKRENIEIVLAGCREFTPELLKEIKARDIPVILPETLALPLDEDDPYDAIYTIPSDLRRAESTLRDLRLFQRAQPSLPGGGECAVRSRTRKDVLKAVTINAAKIWGVDDRIGSVEKGKSADLSRARGWRSAGDPDADQDDVDSRQGSGFGNAAHEVIRPLHGASELASAGEYSYGCHCYIAGADGWSFRRHEWDLYERLLAEK